MANAVLVRAYEEPPVSLEEILRYSGAGRTHDEQMIRMAEECFSLARNRLSYRVCWREFPVARSGRSIDLGFAKVESAALDRYLEGCDAIVLFAATVGIGIDRLIARYETASPARALMLQAVGAERIEALCDVFCADYAQRELKTGRCMKPRFSPGYGDLAIELQKDVFRVLECPKWIGLTLNGSMMMSPSKSVTAMAGIGKAPGEYAGGCAGCAKADCEYRKEHKP